MSVSGEGVYANAEKKYNPTRLFATDTNPKDKSNSIADTSKSGVFRIKRVGSTYTIYKPSGTTVLKKNGKSGTGDVVVTLYGKDNNAGCKVSGVFDNFIVINGTIKNADVCSPDWNCGVWSSCTDSLQTRTCTDDNNCGIETGKPVESRSCSANDPCANKDCGDNNDCTSDSCSQGNCINTPINCPTGQVCSRGSCVNARSTITVTYPNGGEIWYSGNDYTIKWNPSVNENPAIPKIDEYIIDNNGKNAIDPAINRSNSGSDGWTPRNVNGSFKVKICISGTTDCDESDNYFSIKSEQTTCTDSDGGKNYFIRGNFLDKATCLSGCNDSCYDGQSFMQSYGFAVAEWSCENNIANYTTYNCPNGCENGACKLECKPGQTIGDVDGNGIIDTLDSNLTASIIVGKISSPTDICCVDVSGNGGISAIDASKILRIIAGL